MVHSEWFAGTPSYLETTIWFSSCKLSTDGTPTANTDAETRGHDSWAKGFKLPNARVPHARKTCTNPAKPSLPTNLRSEPILTLEHVLHHNTLKGTEHHWTIICIEFFMEFLYRIVRRCLHHSMPHIERRRAPTQQAAWCSLAAPQVDLRKDPNWRCGNFSGHGTYTAISTKEHRCITHIYIYVHLWLDINTHEEICVRITYIYIYIL